MSLAVSCASCGRVFTLNEQIKGRKIRCLACGHVQRVPIFSTSRLDQQSATYPLAPEPAPITNVAKATLARA